MTILLSFPCAPASRLTSDTARFAFLAAGSPFPARARSTAKAGPLRFTGSCHSSDFTPGTPETSAGCPQGEWCGVAGCQGNCRPPPDAA